MVGRLVPLLLWNEGSSVSREAKQNDPRQSEPTVVGREWDDEANGEAVLDMAAHTPVPCSKPILAHTEGSPATNHASNGDFALGA